jgi:hypothetical protein
VVKLLALGGPAEGEMLEDSGFYNDDLLTQRISTSRLGSADYCRD